MKPSPKRDAPVPEEIRKWNWGAFFMHFLWGIAHDVWLSLLVFVPVLGFFWPFVLGAKGNEWAWRAREWESVEEFLGVQRAWSIFGWFVVIVMTTLVVAAMLFAPDMAE